MLQLHLFRHAAASWGAGRGEDFDRPLDPSGRPVASAMARCMADSDVAPELILCSAAQRARETLALTLPCFRHDCEIHIDHSLYLADAAALLEHIRDLPAGIVRCMLIGHNPGFHQLAVLLAGNGDETDLANLRAGFPTCAVAGIEFALPVWRDIGPGSGRLRCFLTPRLLETR